MMGFNGFVITSHRASYFVFVGELVEGMEVCHYCDNPSCVNPDHLYQDTHSKNMKDCFHRGRHNFCNMDRRGEINPACTISVIMIKDAKSMIEGGMKGSEIARILNIGQSSVSRIKRGLRR